MSLFFAVLGSMKPTVAWGVSPTVSAVTVTQGNYGACNKGVLLTNASVVVSWSLTLNGGSGVGYSLRVLQNSSLVAQPPMGSSSAIIQIPYRLAGAFHQFTSNYVYTVSVIRGDGVQTSTANSTAWAALYGTCGP